MSSDDDNGPDRPTCERQRCPSPVQHRGLCSQHWQLWLRDNGPVPAAAVAAHVAALRAAGVGIMRIAALAGVSPRTLSRLSTQATVYSETARKVFAIPLPDLPHVPELAPSCRVPGLGVARRLQALVAAGYTNEFLASQIGYHPAHMSMLVLRGGRHGEVEAKTARQVSTVFERLQFTTAPDSHGARRARSRAVARGWSPPLAWDLDTIDDPTVTPVGVAGPTSRWLPADWVDRVVERRELGRSDERIAADFGIDLESLHRRFDRAGLPRQYGIAS